MLAPERVGECGEAAFSVGQPEPSATKLGFEYAILFLQIGDHLLLVTLDQAGDHDDEDLQDHGVPRVVSRDVMMCSSIQLP